MSYKLTIAARAERDIDDFLTWLDDYNPATAEEYEDDLYEAIRRNVLPRPHTWAPFFLTGRPYRGYLYTVSRRTNFWIVYSISEEDKTVHVLRFWNSARDPETFLG